MKRALWIVLLAAVGAAMAGSSALADTVRLKRGRELKGTILVETAREIIMDVGGGEVRIQRSEILSIERSNPDGEGRPLIGSGVELPSGTVSVFEAPVTVVARGWSRDEVEVNVTPRVGIGLKVHLPAGSYLLPKPRQGLAPAAEMILRQGVTVSLRGEPVTVRAPAVGAKMKLRVPDAKDEFALCHGPRSLELKMVGGHLTEKTRFETCQTIVWILTDNARAADLSPLFSAERPAADTAPGGRAHRDPTLVQALRILDVCALHPERRSIWKDRLPAIVMTLVRHRRELAVDAAALDWARNQILASGYPLPLEELIPRLISEARLEGPVLARFAIAAADLKISAAIDPLARLVATGRFPAEQDRLEKALALLTSGR